MSSNRRGPPRVVVGYDASVSAQVAVGRAADEAERRGLPLSVVHVVDDACRVGGPATNPAGPAVRRPGPAGVSLAQARRIATRGAALARTGHPGLEVRARTLVGSPGTVLVRESEGAALMVVVGARGRGFLLGTTLGPVASRVVSDAACSVAVIRGGTVATPDADRPVVVGVDGSPGAAEALREAASEARGAGAPLRIVCAWAPTAAAGWDRAYWLAVDPVHDPDDTARAAAERVAARAAGVARDLAPGTPVETWVHGGDPAATVLGAARGAGLVVVGAHGRGDVDGAFLGPVSHVVVHGARAPVLVVRGAPRPALRSGGLTVPGVTRGE